MNEIIEFAREQIESIDHTLFLGPDSRPAKDWEEFRLRLLGEASAYRSIIEFYVDSHPDPSRETASA